MDSKNQEDVDVGFGREGVESKPEASGTEGKATGVEMISVAKLTDGDGLDDDGGLFGGSKDEAPGVDPPKRCGPFQWLYFQWVASLVATGAKEPLQMRHLWRLHPRNTARALQATYNNLVARSKRTRHLLYMLVSLVHMELVLGGISMLFYAMFQVAQPILLSQLVQSVQDEDDRGWWLSLLLLGSGAGAAVCNHQHLDYSFLAGIRLRSAVIALVFRRAINTRTAHQRRATGDVVQLLSNDAQKLFDVMPFLHLLWAVPIQTALSIYFLIDLLGASSLVGVGMLFMLVPMSLFVTRIATKLRAGHMKVADTRVRLCTEVLRGIRVVKTSNWEKPLLDRVNELRKSEVKYTGYETHIFAWTIFALIIFPSIGNAATFLVFTTTNRTLTASDAFGAVAFLNMLRFPLNGLGAVLTTGSQTLVAISRLHAFLTEEDIGDAPTIEDPTPSASATAAAAAATAASTARSGAPARTAADPSDPALPLIECPACSIQWAKPGVVTPSKSGVPTTDKGTNDDSSSSDSSSEGSGKDAFLLNAQHFEVHRGELVAVVGSVGAGKTSLLHALLGEMWVSEPAPTSGSIILPGSMSLPSDPAEAASNPSKRPSQPVVRGRVAYVAQQAWLLGDTSIRDNILFGLPMDRQWYSRVLDACALTRDLENMPHGDATIVGEKGVTLSGGQQQRVSIARAVYCRPDVVLLDDPLSALDAHTGRHLFDRVLGPKGLLKDAARVLVTHAVQYLSLAHRVVVLHRGQMPFVGPYEALVVAAQDHLLEVVEEYEAETASGLLSMHRNGDAPVSGAKRACSGAGAGADTEDGAGAGAGAGADRDVSAAGDDGSPSAVSAVSAQRSATSGDNLLSANRAGTLGKQTTAQRFRISLASSMRSLTSLAQETGSSTPGTANHSDGAVDGNTRTLEDVTISSKSGALMSKEDRVVGTVSWKDVQEYIKAMGGLPWICVLVLLFSLERIAYVSIDWWLTLWVATDDKTEDFGIGEHSERFWVWGYVICTAVAGILVALRLHTFVSLCLHAADNLFHRLTNAFFAPMWVFDVTPLGRLLNRFTHDTEVIDTILVQRLNGAVASCFWLSAGVVVMGVAVPWALIALVIVIYLYFSLMAYYRKSNRELQRLDSLARSPVVVNFSESLHGAVTIRAYGLTERFVARGDTLTDSSSSAVFTLQAIARWLGTRIETLGAIISFSVAILAWANRENLASGTAGLAILWSANFTVSLHFIVIMWSETEARFTSVERVLSTSRIERERDECQPLLQQSKGAMADPNVDPESGATLHAPPSDTAASGASRAGVPPAMGASSASAPKLAGEPSGQAASLLGATSKSAGQAARGSHAPGASPPSSWPTRGSVVFSDVVMRYRKELPEPALKGLSFSVHGGEKIGICGRTGAGKSSLAVALLRLASIERGSISIDGVDLASIPLADVRGRAVSLVSQEPVLFSGTIKESLDPLDLCSDEKIWSALDAVAMSEVLRANPLGLAAPVTDNGSNFSQGQRQLLCLARALLRDTKVLVLDEASASIDNETDGILQETVSKLNCTIIIIAHRLNSIMDCHRIVVLDDGKCAEVGTPMELLENPASLLTQLVKATGKEAAEQLREMAMKPRAPIVVRE